MEDKKITEKESLELILSMIQKSQNQWRADSGKSFLLWGYVSFVISLFVWIGVYFMQNQIYSLGYILMPLVGFSLKYILCKRKETEPLTYIEKMVKKMWFVLVLACVVLGFSNNELMILPYVVLLLGVGIAINGVLANFRALQIGGCVNIILFYPMSLLGYEMQTLLLALAFLVSYIIPGHILNHCTKCSKN